MSAAVHLHAEITTQQSETSTTYGAAKQTVTAAQLSTAGFAINDEVLVLWWYKVAASTTNEVRVDLRYNAASILDGQATNKNRVDLGAAARERAFGQMVRMNLTGTLRDFTIHMGTSTAATTAYMEKSKLVIIRLSDFGTENTDWFWNQNLTDVVNTTTYSGTNRAVVTWTPASVEDWVYFARTHVVVDQTANNYEARVMLDTVLNSGDVSMEGESNNEGISLFWFGYLTSLSAASHTLQMETRDDGGTTFNDHGSSEIFVFKKSKWADLFVHQPGTVAVANGSDVQVATITNTLSTTQDLVLAGYGRMDLNTANTQGYMWIRQGGSTVIEPLGNTASGLATGYAYDATDEVLFPILAFLSAQSGTLDLDLFASQTATASRNLLGTKFLVWGMEKGGTDANITATAFTGTSTFPAPVVSSSISLTGTAFAPISWFPAPTVAGGANPTPTVFTGTSTFTAPTVAGGANPAPTVFAGTATFEDTITQVDSTHYAWDFVGTATFPTPTVDTTTAAQVDATAFTGTATFVAPAVSSGVLHAATVFAPAATFPAPTVAGGANPTPTTFTAGSTFPAPTVATGSSLVATAFTGTATFVAPSVSSGVLHTATVFTGTSTFPTPTVETPAGDVEIFPTAFTPTSTFPAPTVAGGAGVTTTAFTGTSTFPAPTVATGASLTATAIVGTSTFPTPVVAAGAAVAGGTIVGTSTFPTPTVTASTHHTATVFVGTATHPTPTVYAQGAGDASVYPTAFTGTATFAAAPTILSFTYYPWSFIGEATFPVPLVGGDQLVTPNVLVGYATFRTPLVTTRVDTSVPADLVAATPGGRLATTRTAGRLAGEERGGRIASGDAGGELRSS